MAFTPPPKSLEGLRRLEQRPLQRATFKCIARPRLIARHSRRSANTEHNKQDRYKEKDKWLTFGGPSKVSSMLHGERLTPFTTFTIAFVLSTKSRGPF